MFVNEKYWIRCIKIVVIYLLKSGVSFKGDEKLNFGVLKIGFTCFTCYNKTTPKTNTSIDFIMFPYVFEPIIYMHFLKES